MKSSIILRLATLSFLLQLPLHAQGPKEDDFLIFDKIEEDVIAKPSLGSLRRTTPSAPTKATSKRPLPSNTKASLHTILLDVPDKSFATARLSTLTATATQDGTEATPEIDFSDATASLQTSCEKAAAALVTANPQFPDGVTLKVKADGGYKGHEKDVAGAAAAILLEAIGTGRVLDSDAAILGGVGDKGQITAVSRLATRLRTLEGATPSVIGVPMVSEVEVRDLALMSELEVLAKFQIVSLVTLDDARAITAKERPEKIDKAFKLFASVTTAAATKPVSSLIKNPTFVQRLQEIVALMPNHLSARLILLAAYGKVPGTITYATSRQAILKAIKPFVNVTSTNRPAKEIQTVATEGGNVLLRLQPKAHPDVARYLAAMKAYLRAVNNLLDIQNDAQHQVMRNRALAEIGKLLANVQAEKEKLDKKEGTLQ